MDAITREEKIMTGADLKPITRREMFLKKIADSNGNSGNRLLKSYTHTTNKEV